MRDFEHSWNVPVEPREQQQQQPQQRLAEEQDAQQPCQADCVGQQDVEDEGEAIVNSGGVRGEPEGSTMKESERAQVQ
jgi:hypothetical protein